MLTGAQLLAIMPRCPKPEAYAPLLADAMRAYDINTITRAAAFLGQLAHESGQLRYLEELASGANYEGRKGLGNTQPGDGVRYKGRGPIQITGRANYRAAGLALGLPLEDQPKLLLDPATGFRAAAWFWWARGLSHLADAGDVTAITRVINGGYHGLDARQGYTMRALIVLGAVPLP